MSSLDRKQHHLMQRRLHAGLVASLLVSLSFFVGCAPKVLPIPSEIPLAEYTELIKPTRVELDNGLTLQVVENWELPIVSGALIIPGGSLLDTKALLTPTMAHQMRAGGAGKFNGQELDSELLNLSAVINSSAGQESVTIGFSCLAPDLERVMKLFAHVTLRPRFDSNRFSLWRVQALEGIRRRTDEPWAVAGVAFQQLVFGDTPYGRSSTSAQVRAISRADLIAKHRAVINPNGAYFAVSGAVKTERITHLLQKEFGDWQLGIQATTTAGTQSKGAQGTTPTRDLSLPPLNFKPTPGLYFVELPLSQASVLIGHQGVARLTDDYPAIDVFNQIFGSGFFGSRLMQTVRTERGLVYGIGGAVTSGPMVGRASIGFQTKAESVNDAITASLDELLKLRTDLIKDDELRETQGIISNNFVFKFDSMSEVAQRAVNLELLKYPADYNESYLPKIRSVTADEVREVALKRWNTEGLVILVVGNKSVWEKLPELSKYPPLANLPLKKLKFNEVLR